MSRIKIGILICTSTALLITISVMWYYIPRTVTFELERELDLPCPDLDYYNFIGFFKAEDENRLKFWLVEQPTRDHYGWQYDSLFVDRLAEELDFDEYDYLIAFQKELLKLRYSPYLRKTEDGLYFDKRIPLIASWDTLRTDKVYLYRIKSNASFRSIGP